MKLNLKDYNPVKMVGDGGHPNLFWVTATTGFKRMYREDDAVYIDYAGDLMEQEGIKSKSLPQFDAVFDDLDEALEYIDNHVFTPEEPLPNHPNSVVIEDRQHGVIWERSLVAYSRAKWGGWTFETETWDDTDWVRESE